MSKANVLFRVDSGEHIGSGHIMRCLTIAQLLRDKGCNIYFFSKPHYGHCLKEITDRGFKLFLLSEPDQNAIKPIANWCAHAAWLKGTEEQDAGELLELLERAKLQKRIDWVIVDHFALTSQWHKKIKEKTRAQVMVIDGLADRALDCDLLLDPNLIGNAEERWSQWVPPQAKLFVGPQYFPLRPEFMQHNVEVRTGPVNRILICFGGVDKDNVTLLSCHVVNRWLSNIKHNCSVDVVIGKGHPFRNEITHACSEMGFQLFVQTKEIAELMKKADLAIGAAGTMAWERCKMALPCIMTVIADNQKEQAQSLAAKKAAITLGELGELTETKMFAALNHLDNQPDELKRMSEQALAIMSEASPSPAWVREII